MAWNDRLKEAAYTSPSGQRVLFSYENVSKEVEKRTSAFEFPDADGTFIQDLGHSGRKFPLRIFFWGEDYDLQANVFDAALLERGQGKLEHPFYGTVDVVPFGPITRRDDLKTAANQAVFQVTFWETTGLVFPTGQTDPVSAITAAVQDYNEALANEFELETNLSSAVNAAVLLNDYELFLDTTEDGLRAIADVQDNVRQQFNAISDSINRGIDVLISQPLSLAFQTELLIQTPALAAASIQARLSAYKNLADDIIEGITDAPPDTLNDEQKVNEFKTKDLYAATYVTGSVLSAVNNQFATKTGALDAADQILTQFGELVVWRDDNNQALGLIDTGASYQQLLEAVALTAGFLVDVSFSLKQERRVVLTRKRTIVDLVAEIYGTVDSELDFFIQSNNLSGSEILELPEGREIVFYV